MNKTVKTILIFTIAVFGAGLVPTFALAADLEVHFQETPLFDEANFLPGQTVTRSVEVKNNATETKKVGVEIIDKLTPQCSTNCLSDVLDLTISEQGGNTLLSGSLTAFYGAGEKILSDLAPNSTTTYLFAIIFRPLAGNNYQDSKSNFDVKIGFFGKEAIGQEISPGQISGGGTVSLPGLEISNEQFSEITENSVTITWQTNSLSTSRVIYSPRYLPHILDTNNPPNYGYAFSTAEDSNKVIDHTISIAGLAPGTTYYFRCVSHGSLAIGREFSFTTLGIKGEEVILPEQILPQEGEVLGEEIVLPEGEGPAETEIPEEEEILAEEETGLPEFLAAIGNLFKLKNLLWILLTIAVVILILFFLSRKNKKIGLDRIKE